MYSFCLCHIILLHPKKHEADVTPLSHGVFLINFEIVAPFCTIYYGNKCCYEENIQNYKNSNNSKEIKRACDNFISEHYY